MPEKRKVYLVEFSLRGDGCQQQVYDITQASARMPVALLEDFPPASRKVSED
ncbi:hypothetical protein [Pseudomonas vanderleydeniana]|uniref:Uncharacterized protein n=1 Tax=Pseudomonas vanderleydeniana TaxID=2745495 RepID=A0A9E6TSZ8_9PSED|nr:hypothetical protein [Pseudomonas vanderleydeniana]QXI29111.1 hypothetical protein HU752_003850 [Pseudomonas vanderleydeniana]